METKIFESGELKIEFENRGFETRYSWGHISELIINNEVKARNKATYLNRTWESYRFQSVMRQVLWDYISSLEKGFILEHKRDKGISRLSKDKKEALSLEFKDKNKDLFNIYNQI